MALHPDVGVDLFLQASDQGHVLPDGLLEVQDAAALLLGVTGDLQLETHTLLLLTVLLDTSHTQPEMRPEKEERIEAERNRRLMESSYNKSMY